MNIDDIEDNLNNFEIDDDKILSAILNTSLKNQALLEALIELQLNTLATIAPDIDFDRLSKNVSDNIAIKLASIQAAVVSRYHKE
jgi:hypothetical protein